MNSAELIAQVLSSLRILVKEYDILRIDRADLSNPSELVSKSINNDYEMIEMVKALLDEAIHLEESERRKVILCICRMYKNLCGFEKECLRIIGEA